MARRERVGQTLSDPVLLKGTDGASTGRSRRRQIGGRAGERQAAQRVQGQGACVGLVGRGGGMASCALTSSEGWAAGVSLIDDG